jgi:flagellar biosynthesis protein FlhA
MGIRNPQSAIRNKGAWMSDMATTIKKLSSVASRHRGLALPVAAAMLVLVVLAPLPPGLMDLLLAANIAMSAIILLTTMNVASPLEFSVFPSVLLGATLVRLALNIATTRLILTCGNGSAGLEEAQFAAGHVVWAFGNFVTAGSLAVGVIIFTIVVIVQFVVITSGASRISEVAARFVLDAMPGKQMAIDADLNAGLIDQAAARERRQGVSQQADFYGAMDGASKFLRGDAIAGIFIIAVNILGGLYVGMVQYGWDFSRTVELFTRLTIGEGLVAQLPAVIVSCSAALLVTRSTSKTDFGKEVVGQLLSRPAVLILTAIFLGALMLTSLPKLPLLMIGGGLAGLAWLLMRRGEGEEAQADASPASATAPAAEAPEQMPPVEALRIELGFSLVRLADAQRDGDLVDRLAGLRRRIAGELGFTVPRIHIHDNMQIDAHLYVIKVRGAKVATGRLYPGQLLAVASTGPAGQRAASAESKTRTGDGANQSSGGDGHNVTGSLTGRHVDDPVFGSPAVWISHEQAQHAAMMGYGVSEPSDVLISHLTEVIRSHCGELLSRQQVAKALEGLKATAPSLVAEVTGRLRVGQVQKVLQNLLAELVSIRDMEAILEELCEQSAQTTDVAALTARVRSALARTLTQQYCAADGKLWCVSLADDLEQTLGSYVPQERASEAATLPAELSGRVRAALAGGLSRLSAQGKAPVLLCAPHVRSTLRQLVAGTVPGAAVLAYNEIQSAQVQSIASIGIT